MQNLVPEMPSFPAMHQSAMPACEWVMPAAASRRLCDYSLWKVLPAGMPDCLQVHIVYRQHGTERSTAALYGSYAYLIHYEFKSD